MENKEFNKSLSNFINDAAAGGAVRHLADLGYSISEIAIRLDYPISKEKIARFMWEYFVNIGKICLEEPKETFEKISYVKEQDDFGRISFRRVKEAIDNSNRLYVKCEFGFLLYSKDDEFMKKLHQLNINDREYIEIMPWPLKPVFHEMDDRMKRINYYI